MVKRSKNQKKFRRLNPLLPPGITHETIGSLKNARNIYSGYGDYGDIEKKNFVCLLKTIGKIKRTRLLYENGYSFT